MEEIQKAVPVSVSETKPKRPVAFRMPDPDPEVFAKLCKALAHPARVKILSYLKAQNRCICGKIVDSLPLAQSTVSQHLKILKASGLVRGIVEGPRTCYCLDHEVLEAFKKMAETL